MVRLKRHLPMSATIAIIIHVAVVLLLVLGYQMKRETAPNPSPAINIIKAKVINSKQLDEDKKRKQEEEKKKLEAELKVENKKALEVQKSAELERKKVEEAKKKGELEKKKIAEKAKKKAELKKAEEAKKAAAVKKVEKAKKLAEEKQRKEQAAEQERLAKILEQEEAELNAAELVAQRAANSREIHRLIAQYQDAIRSKIQSRWRKPLNEQPDAWCRVYVLQTPGGYVENVVVEQCTGDEAFRRSVEEAVWKSDPLPQPPLPELFDREIRFKFIPEI